MGTRSGKFTPTASHRGQVISPLETALLDVYDECAAGLLRYATTCTHEDGAAQEAVQQAFLDLLTSWRSGEEIPQPREWLYRAIRRYFVSAGQRAEQREAAAEGLLLEAGGLQTPDLDAPVRRDEVRRRLARISSPREFEILQLRVEGFSYEEIARILDIHPGTVASTLSRALRKVRHAFRGYFP